MKKGFHPEYLVATVSCTCGNTWQTRDTRAKLALDVCSACHPFFTGQQKYIDTAGRIERFQKKWGKKAETKETKK